MIRESSTIAAGTQLEHDICIIGAGAAGIALALDLARRGRNVCLLESGGEAIQSSVQSLYHGAAGAESFFGQADYVWSSRLRFLGGATNHWHGECEQLGAASFAPRDAVPHSGWPIEAATLAPWYEPAAEWLELSVAPARDSAEELAGFEAAPRRWSPPTRFGTRYRGDLAAASNLLVLLRANAVALHTNESGASVEAVEVAAGLGADRFRVRAAHTVLAAGALENPRLLLVSPRQPGNAHDQVGRYFMDGIEGRVAQLMTRRPSPNARQGDERTYRAVAPSPATQRERGWLDTRFVFEPVPAKPTGFAGALGALAARVAAAGGANSAATGPHRLQHVVIGSEMAPNPANRVTLSDKADALGVPKLRLEAAPGELESSAIAAATLQLGASLGASLAGRLRITRDPEEPWSGLTPAQHPSGTTRMHREPEHGVVDANCQVHGVANLYVAGSSVFPSGSHARPTWTLLALALRLADHLASQPLERT